MFVVTAASEHDRAGCLVGFTTPPSVRTPGPRFRIQALPDLNPGHPA